MLRLGEYALSTPGFEAICLILTIPVTLKSTKLTLIQATIAVLHPVMRRKNPAMWYNLNLTSIRAQLSRHLHLELILLLVYLHVVTCLKLQILIDYLTVLPLNFLQLLLELRVDCNKHLVFRLFLLQLARTCSKL